MAISIGAVMRQCKNYFERECISGDFVIKEGKFVGVDFGAYRYFAISGSAANNGVHRVPATLIDESFKGKVWLLSPPPDFLAMCENIAEYDSKNPAGSMVSESFGDYSYNRGGGVNGAFRGWQSAFSSQLSAYQKPISEVMV